MEEVESYLIFGTMNEFLIIEKMKSAGIKIDFVQLGTLKNNSLHCSVQTIFLENVSICSGKYQISVLIFLSTVYPARCSHPTSRPRFAFIHKRLILSQSVNTTIWRWGDEWVHNIPSILIFCSKIKGEIKRTR